MSSTRTKLLMLVEDVEIVSKEFLEYIGSTRSSHHEDIDADQLVALLKMKDEELHDMLKTAKEQMETQKKFEALQLEVEKRDQDIRQLQRSLKETESLLATAIYQAKQKLQAISQANSRKISSEELIKYAHKISASNAVAVPSTWNVGKDSTKNKMNKKDLRDNKSTDINMDTLIYDDSTNQISADEPSRQILTATETESLVAMETHETHPAAVVATDNHTETVVALGADNALGDNRLQELRKKYAKGDPRRPYPTEMDMRAGVLARLSELPMNSHFLQSTPVYNDFVGRQSAQIGALQYMNQSSVTWQPSAEVQSMTVSSGVLASQCSTTAATVDSSAKQHTVKDTSDDVELMSSDSSSSSSSDE